MGNYSKRKEYNKLIRDGIPEFLEKKGVVHETHIAHGDELKLKVLEKVIEEALELQQASTKKELVEELADLEEILSMVYRTYHLNADDVSRIRDEKRKKRGGFEKGIILDWS